MTDTDYYKNGWPDAWQSGYTAAINRHKTSDSNLVAYARRELELLGEDEDTIDGTLRVIQAVADMGHSGSSVMFFIPMLRDLLNFKPLTPLTNDPDEWLHVADEMPHAAEPGVWQCRRDPEAFSHDGGKTYYLLSERSAAGDLDTTPLHTAEDKKFPEGESSK